MKRSIVYLVLCFCLMIAGIGTAAAHTTDQAFVLLLPTGVYTVAGVAAVALSAIILALLPHSASGRFFTSKAVAKLRLPDLATLTSLTSLALLMVLVFAGFTASRDPFANPLPLYIWTLWWIGFVTVQALVGDIWRWVNPWSGLHRLFFGAPDDAPPLSLPAWLGCWPGIAGFLAFGYFTLADPAPSDPARLASAVTFYWLYTFAGLALFGPRAWLERCECFTMLLSHYARLSAAAVVDGAVRVGVPGWRMLQTPTLSISAGIFVILMLGTGSFDGLNETFWWLDKLGVNPLEFPGRSAVIWQTTMGILAANLALCLVFAAAIWLGLRLARADIPFATAFGRLSLSILPIALGYHVAHYLTAFLVQAQYALAAANDPWATGANYLGLAGFHVTTGFFNTKDTVRVIWLSQAGAVVVGHMLSVLLAHAIAARMFPTNRQAILSQLPLAGFMIFYTFFGLWLLASPRGA